MVAEVPNQKLVAFKRRLGGADRCSSFVGSVVGYFR